MWPFGIDVKQRHTTDLHPVINTCVAPLVHISSIWLVIYSFLDSRNRMTSRQELKKASGMNEGMFWGYLIINIETDCPLLRTKSFESDLSTS